MDKITELLHSFEHPEDYDGAIVPPLFSTSLFTFSSFEDLKENRNREGRFYYSRMSNPTVKLLEKKLAMLENGEDCRCFSSGMAAISAAILSRVKPGDHVVCIKSVYGSTFALLNEYLPTFGVETTFVEGTDPEDYERVAKPNTVLFYLESPSSFLFNMQDIARIAEIARSKGIFTIMDNSWSTPLFQNPLDYNVDMVVHSVTKYIGGHSDVVAGAAIGSHQAIKQITDWEGALFGGSMSPQHAWLVLRGLRTLSLRMDRHQQSALMIAEMLTNHPLVEQVYFPGSSTRSITQKALAGKYLKGHSGLMSIKLKGGGVRVKTFVNRLRLFKIGCSWGGYESLVMPPSAVDQAVLERKNDGMEEEWQDISESLVRISIGLENLDDLLADLRQALETD